MGCFSWPSQRFALVLRKVQIRKALGNEGWLERITQQPGMGPRNVACGDGLAEQVKYRWNQDRDGFLSLSCSQKGDPACPAGPWSLLCVPQLVEVGEKTGSPWRLPNLIHLRRSHVAEPLPRGRLATNKNLLQSPCLLQPPHRQPSPGPLRCLTPTVLLQKPRKDPTGSCLFQK